MDKIRAAQITAKALQTRKKYLGTAPHLPICPYALCEAMGFDLRFFKVPSFEGMYVAELNKVLISAERPEGRKRFTYSHEIGHHILGHGTVIDEMLAHGSDNQEEQEADFFASMLLMPSSAVTRILNRYQVSAENLTSIDAYILSKYFGVSYKAFLIHIYSNLHLITYRQYQNLNNAKLPDIRRSISGINTKNQVFKIGSWWDEKSIEMEVGDIIVATASLSIDGPMILKETSTEDLFIYEAIRPGITRVSDGDEWSFFTKISRYKFQGLYQYKYEEEEEDEE
ncbi:MAG: ImmA/IrrE family metallo-endopeptidase [Candidatus Thiodiazotropha sp. (ex Ctena orbiculata)]|nr:ImmA/IrrE family metallo-endopeptidase [Candidatus Thiodiazotropha taylori]